jgi:rod shape-determining protein MreD
VTRLIFALIIATLAIAQAALIPAINLLTIGPNFVLVLILVWSAESGMAEGVIWTMPVGILLDLLALDPLGANTLALIPVAIIGGLASRRLFHSGVIFPMLLVVVATIVHQTIGAIVSSATGSSYPLLATVRLSILTALLNVAMVPIFYIGIAILDRLGVIRASRA